MKRRLQKMKRQRNLITLLHCKSHRFTAGRVHLSMLTTVGKFLEQISNFGELLSATSPLFKITFYRLSGIGFKHTFPGQPKPNKSFWKRLLWEHFLQTWLIWLIFVQLLKNWAENLFGKLQVCPWLSVYCRQSWLSVYCNTIAGRVVWEYFLQLIGWIVCRHQSIFVFVL